MARRDLPTRRAALLFRTKVVVHQIARGLRNRPAGLRRFQRTGDPGFALIVGQSRTALWPDDRPGERAYQLGKVQNLRRAVAALDGAVVPAGEVFSFWKQVGRATRRRGFVPGRMLQQGCLVPAVGGGLCQLSNALYEAALQAGCEIVERHAHSRIVPGSAAALGRDATVAWNYVDLRFRPRQALRIEARVERDALVIRFCARPDSNVVDVRPPHSPVAHAPAIYRGVANSCATCDETACFRHEPPQLDSAVDSRTAYLVDENWPEFREFVAAYRRPQDVLGIPFDGDRWRLSRYRWDTRGFAQVGAASFQAAARTMAMRRLPAQGAARRLAELAASERIARSLARLLTPDIETVCVAQSLLPFLWRDGHLGGREVAVLMTRLPIGVLQARLDRVFAAHPDRATLGDFRAPAWLVDAEAEALDYAVRIVTPHAEIVELFPEKAAALDWQMPAVAPITRSAPACRVAFPGPTVARKGAHELREAARALDLEIVLLGNELEGPDFWRDVPTFRTDAARDPGAWLAGVAAVVQPALVEDRPRHLLTALAAEVPVIATAACGIASHERLTIVPPDDIPALITALRTVLGAASASVAR